LTVCIYMCHTLIPGPPIAIFNVFNTLETSELNGIYETKFRREAQQRGSEESLKARTENGRGEERTAEERTTGLGIKGKGRPAEILQH